MVSFFGALRILELTPVNKLSSSGIKNEHIAVDSNIIKVFINRSKMDQLGKGQWIVLLPCTKEITCPVFTLRQYTARRPHIAGHFFVTYGWYPSY